MSEIVDVCVYVCVWYTCSPDGLWEGVAAVSLSLSLSLSLCLSFLSISLFSLCFSVCVRVCVRVCVCVTIHSVTALLQRFHCQEDFLPHFAAAIVGRRRVMGDQSWSRGDPRGLRAGRD